MMKPTATTLPATFGRVFTRGFHATATVSAKPHQKRLDSMLEGLPPYPHPIQQTFKQSWFGLYGGKHIQFGNNVPDSRYKTRRNWLPNIRQKKLFSKCLNKSIELSVTASVLRKYAGWWWWRGRIYGYGWV